MPYSASARELYMLSAHCNTVFSVQTKKGVYLMGQPCPILPLKLMKISMNLWWSYNKINLLHYKTCFKSQNTNQSTNSVCVCVCVCVWGVCARARVCVHVRVCGGVGVHACVCVHARVRLFIFLLTFSMLHYKVILHALQLNIHNTVTYIYTIYNFFHFL